MSEPLSLVECEDHVRDIASQLNCNSFVREGFQGALDLIAADLYKDSSHFLLELIQNADDNTYPQGETPQVTFYWDRSGLLFFACNEVGFSKADLSALCSANRSTKKLHAGKIGEKGIGFKSVFKVCNEVWIKSGHFSFKFDKRRPLGMIAPSLAVFPALPEAYQATTMFCIKIEGKSQQLDIYDQLRALQPSVLMFLRGLAKIKLVFAKESGVTSETTLACHQEPLEDLRLATTTKSSTSSAPAHEESKYILSEYIVKDMPVEEKRPQVTESSMVLAFPVDKDWMPVHQEQLMHAFLPICHSGFPFLIQADFLLVSSRQDIDTSSPWNRRLRDRFVHALVEAFHRLNGTQLKYTWPQFVPRGKAGRHPFLGFVVDQILKKLRNEAILEGWVEGEFSPPNSLCFLPSDYLDDDQQPLLPAPDYLSSRYAPEDLEKIVTKTLTAGEFVAIFKLYITKNSEAFRSKPNVWHANIAKILLDAMKLHPKASDLAHLVLVPLSNGAWTASHRKTIYLPRVLGVKVPLPPDIEIVTIDPAAAENPHRSSLFQWLGAKMLKHEDVSKEIVRRHEFQKDSLTLEMLVSHAQYLFHTPDDQRVPLELQRKLWVADTESVPRHGNVLYLDDPKSNRPVSDYFKSNPNIAPFLHRNYQQAYSPEPGMQDRWISWLQKHLGISANLRLTAPNQSDISPEFKYIIENNPSPKWLTVLRDNYLNRPFLAEEEMFRQKIAAMPVTCVDGATARLQDTVLPTLYNNDPFTRMANLRFVRLEDEHKGWAKLSAFGVITTPDLRFKLKTLLGLQQANYQPKRIDAEQIYRDILSKNTDPRAHAITRALFEAHPLVYVGKPHVIGSGQWTDLTACCWDAPDCLQRVRALKPYFGALSPLFQTILGVRDASVELIMGELIELDNDLNSVTLIKQMLLALSVQIAKAPAKTEASLRKLDKHRLIPVVSKEGQPMLVTLSDQRWYIPDRKSYRTVFRGKVHLLDFTLREQDELVHLLVKVEATNRNISKRVVENTITKGKEEAAINAKFTNAYRNKVKYVLALVGEADEYRIAPLLAGMEVYGVDSIILRRSIRTNQNNLIGGNDEAGDMIVETGLKIYISKRDLLENEINYDTLAASICSHANISRTHREVISQIMSLSPRHIEVMLEQKDLNFEKRILPIVNIKLIDDSAGIIVPKASVVPAAPVTTTAAAVLMAPPPKPTTALATPKGVALPAKNIDEPQAAVTAKRQQGASLRSIESEEDQAKKDLQQKLQNIINQSNRLRISDETKSGQSIDVPQKTWKSTQGHGSTGSAGSTGMTGSTGFTGPSAFARSNAGPRNVSSVPDDHIREIVDSDSSSSSSSSPVLRPQPSRSSLVSRGGSVTPDTSMISSSDDAEVIRIGEQGEWLVYKFLQTLVGDEFDENNWTSSTRASYTAKPFKEDDSKYADFTLCDINDKFTRWLIKRGCQQAEHWVRHCVAYHLEVKSTYGPKYEGFHMSQNQLDLAHDWKVDAMFPKDVYVILRVFNMTGKPEIHPYVDPATLFEKGALNFIAPEGYHVFAT